MNRKFSWKTSAAGIVAVVGTVIAHFFPQFQPIWNNVLGIAVGAGLISARDNKVSSEEAGAK